MKKPNSRQEGLLAGGAAMLVLLTNVMNPKVSFVIAFVVGLLLQAINYFRNPDPLTLLQLSMKKLMPLLMILSLVFLYSACSKDDGPSQTAKGLVSFKQNPAYTSNKISFSMQIQFGGGGKAVDIEYKLLDGSTVVASGKSSANSNPDGFKLFYETPMVEITVDGNALKGKTLTVFLDPDNKRTLQEYTTETYVNLYKKASVLIP